MKHMQQNMNPLEIGQVCIIVRDREKAMQQLRSMWGIGPFKLLDVDLPEGIVHGKRTHYKGKLAFAQAGPIELELIEPEEDKSIWWEFLRDKGEGVHHLGIWVSDMDNELARFNEMGIGVLQYGEDESIKFAYMDTETVTGVIFELLQHK